MLLCLDSLSWQERLAAETAAAPFVATIGNFDGVHRGHQALVGQTVARARALGVRALALTFHPHPALVMGKRPFLSLTNLDQRLQRLHALGLDSVLVIPFSRELASLSALDFCQLLFGPGAQGQELFVGYDFRMGCEHAGHEVLLSHSQTLGFALHTVGAYVYEGEAVSSTRIRQALDASDLELARRMLGREHAIRGVVIHGQGRGGPLLGFPTANMETSAYAMPAPGVYATSTRILEQEEADCRGREAVVKPVPEAGPSYPSMTSFGRNPTFGAGELILETHLLDFAGDLYGKHLEVTFHALMRPAQKFSGPDALKTQLQADLAMRRKKDLV